MISKRKLSLLLVVSAALLVMPVAAQGALIGKGGKGGQFVLQDAGGEKITVRSQNGKIVVRINGKKAPKDRVEIEGGHVTINDAGGDEMIELHLKGRDLTLSASAREVKKERRIGVSLRDVDSVTASQLGLDSGEGMIVLSVQGDMPAMKAGVLPSDIIVAIDGKKATLKRLKGKLKKMDDDDSLTLKLLRGGKPKVVEVDTVLVDPKSSKRFGGVPALRFLDRETLKGGVALDDVTNQLPILGDVFVQREGQDGTQRLEFKGGRVVGLEQKKKKDADLGDLARRVGELQNKLERIEKLLRKLSDDR